MRACGYAMGALLLLLLAAPLRAQQTRHRFAAPPDSAAVHATWTPVRVAKWGALLAGTGAVVYGFMENRAADRDYAEIERLCLDAETSCARMPNNGPYSDATLEARYQSVVRRDARARDALLMGQVGIAASVALFIIDLPKGTAPEDIPYQPHSLRFGLRPRELGFRWTVPFR